MDEGVIAAYFEGELDEETALARSGEGGGGEATGDGARTLNDEDIFGTSTRKRPRSGGSARGQATLASTGRTGGTKALNDEDIFGSSKLREATGRPREALAAERPRRSAVSTLVAANALRDVPALELRRARPSVVHQASEVLPRQSFRASADRPTTHRGWKRTNVETKPRVDTVSREKSVLLRGLHSTSEPTQPVQGKSTAKVARPVPAEPTRAKKHPEKTTYGLPRKASEVPACFEDMDWRTTREVIDHGRIPPLAELCLRKIVASNHRLGDLGGMPDRYVFAFLENATPDTVRQVGRLNPRNAKACDGAWSRICRSELGIEELPAECGSWQDLYRQKEEEQQAKLHAAAERLRVDYRREDSERGGKKMKVMSKFVMDPDVRKTIKKSNLRPIERLRRMAQHTGRSRSCR